MPNLKASIKDVRKTKRRKKLNLTYKNKVKSCLRSFKDAVASKEDEKKASDLLSSAYKALDKSVKRGVLHKNTAARRKSSLAKMIAKK